MRRCVRMAIVSLTIALTFVLCTAGAQAFPGQHLWQDWIYIGGVYEDEQAVAVAMAPGGYPVVVGTTVTPGGDRDIRFASYDATTSVWRWNAVLPRWDGPGGGDDTPAGVVIDKAGDAYIAGTTTVPGGGTDIVVLKILGTDTGPLPGGTVLWARRYNGGANRDDEAEAIARDAAGNVYVTGGSRRADGSWDMITVKYRPNGTRAWTRRHNNGARRFDRGLAIAVRGSKVYVAGVSRRKGRADDVVLIKYTTAGKQQWRRYYDDRLHRSEGVTGIACTSSSVYVCGAGKFTSIKPGQAMLLKYGANGKRRWVRFAGGTGGDDSWADVAVDRKGRVHVTGTFFRAATADDIETRVYYASGRRQWRFPFTSQGSGLDTGTALAVDSSRRTYVCGSLQNAGGDADMIVLCYPAAGGGSTWFTRYPDPAVYAGEANVGEDRANDIALVGGAAYVVGGSTVEHFGTPTLDFQTVKIER